ncbi:MAG: AMP-binding protein [Akkermansia sp.]
MTDIGQQQLRTSGNFLVLNKISLKALQLLEKELSGRTLLYLVEDSCPMEASISNYLNSKSADGISFSFDSSDLAQLGKHLAEQIEAGKTVIALPGKVTARRGTINHIPDYVLDALADLDIPTTPVYVGYYGESILNAELPTETNANIFIKFCPQLKRGEEMAARIGEAWLEASADKFSTLPQLQGSIATHVLMGMKRHSDARLIDGIDDSVITFGRLLGVAIAFSKRLKQITSHGRIGIILPPGKGASIANLACLFAGKVPVNINYSNSEESFKSAVRQSGIEQFITADTFMRKLQIFPWPPRRDLIFLEVELKNIIKSIKKWVILSKLMPAHMLVNWLNLDQIHGEDEAVLLFTSGSSSEPKGVMLSHKNVLANIAQALSRIDLAPKSRFLSSLPVFHGFGITIGLWLPLISGHDFVTYPSPLEAKRLGELIKLYKTELVVSTPTFLRGFIKRCAHDTFQSVKYLIVGAEKLPSDLSATFTKKFGIEPCEGYGLSEASPVCSVNFKNLEPAQGATSIIPCIKHGSVGALLPGLAVRITSPHDGRILPITHKGMIWLKGANVFTGYLNNKSNQSEIFKDGWFKTGDIGSADPQGFLRIEGRLSRFSKIAGEMVSHEMVEQAIMKALNINPEDEERHIAIVSIPDGQRGEAMALLTTMISSEYLHQEKMTIRYKILDQGLPAFWCPKEIIPVRSIPCLPTGKLDLAHCKKIAFDILRLR